MYDSAECNQFIVVITNKEVLFNESRNGLYYHDMEDCDLVLVDTVEENREVLSQREMSGSRETRQALSKFSLLSQKTFEHMVHTINNFPITIENSSNSNTIYGCNVLNLKGETVRQQPKHIQA